MSRAAAADRLRRRGIQPRGGTLEEASELIGISPHKYLSEQQAGRLPGPRRFGRRSVYDLRAVEVAAFGDSELVAATQEAADDL